jgi:thiamine pyrophosphokinase
MTAADATIRGSETGSSGNRAERAADSAADPPNLIWVMPAEEGRVSNELVVVVAGGEAPDPGSTHGLPAGAPVVAADRGLEHALALGLTVAVAVGDFDSASPESVAAAEQAGARIERHPAAKDATDLELALDVALALAPERILVLAGVGERLDHLLAALLLIAAPRYAGVEIDARIGRSLTHVVRDERTLAGTRGELVSLVPVHGAVAGVRTDGLLYPLDDETLDAGSTRGVSNEFAAATARVSVASGTLLAVRPDFGGDEPK